MLSGRFALRTMPPSNTHFFSPLRGFLGSGTRPVTLEAAGRFFFAAPETPFFRRPGSVEPGQTSATV